MQQFSILSPVLGKREDVPAIFLHKTMTPEIQNCQFWKGAVRTSYGRAVEIADASGVAIATPDGKPVIKYLYHQSDNASKNLLAFTTLNIFRWVQADGAWTTMVSGLATLATAQTWGVAQLNGQVVATNNITNGIYKWDGDVSNQFVPLLASTNATANPVTRAKAVINYENHIVFGNYDIGSDTFQNGYIMSDLDDLNLWDLSAAGDQSAYYSEGDGIITGFGKKKGFLYIFKTRSHRAWWYTGTSAIMNSREGNVNTGCFANDTIINDGDGNLFFLDSDMHFREVDQGIISLPEMDTTRTINTVNTVDATGGHEIGILGSRAIYIPEYNEVWWAIPTGTLFNDKILCYQLNGKWYERDTSLSAFGQYTPSDDTSYTWDNQPEGPWDDWTGIWDDATESAGFANDICSDYYGYTYRVHGSTDDRAWNGSAMASTNPVYKFVMTTDLGDKGLLRLFKRLLYSYMYFNNISAGTISIYVKEDSAKVWGDAVGSITTDGNDTDVFIGELALDHRAKTYLIKIESSDPFEFLGAMFEFNMAGLR